jgi:hypothetical protein
MTETTYRVQYRHPGCEWCDWEECHALAEAEETLGHLHGFEARIVEIETTEREVRVVVEQAKRDDHR